MGRTTWQTHTLLRGVYPEQRFFASFRMTVAKCSQRHVIINTHLAILSKNIETNGYGYNANGYSYAVGL
jgi:hypothetical protein